MAQDVSICIVLDRSGSMESCRMDALGAVNGYLRQVRDDAEMNARASVILFDTGGIDRIRDHVAVGTCADITADEYQPRGGTPLLDAVGHAVGLLEKHSKPSARSILVVMTDGEENSSREYSKEAIAKLLKRKQDDNGWLVVYLGANHDAWAQASSMGLAASNTAMFALSAMADTGDVAYRRSARYSKARNVKADLAEGFTSEEREKLRGA